MTGTLIGKEILVSVHLEVSDEWIEALDTFDFTREEFKTELEYVIERVLQEYDTRQFGDEDGAPFRDVDGEVRAIFRAGFDVEARMDDWNDVRDEVVE